MTAPAGRGEIATASSHTITRDRARIGRAAGLCLATVILAGDLAAALIAASLLRTIPR